jgi:predicted alpha/beta superfamily hydrolase
MTTTPATILASTMYLMDSQQNGRQYRITVSLPLGYDKSPDEGWPFRNTPERWPVVYVPDGNWYVGMATEIVRYMSRCGSTTDAIIVSIGYAEADNVIEAFKDSSVKRDIDLTPVRDEAVEVDMADFYKRPAPNGDSAGFLKFLSEELIPKIENEYRADPSRRILLGHSYGGLFALYALFENPALFDTLIVGSPTLSYGNRYLFQQEEAFAKDHQQLTSKVYFFVGEGEEGPDETTVTDMLRMIAVLQSRKYEGLVMEKRIFPDLNHCEVVAPGFQAGLKFALKR